MTKKVEILMMFEKFIGRSSDKRNFKEIFHFLKMCIFGIVETKYTRFHMIVRFVLVGVCVAFL